MSFANNLGRSLRSFTRGFKTVSDQFNCLLYLPKEAPPLVQDQYGRFIVPDDYTPEFIEIKLFLERDRAPQLDFEPGTSANRVRMKGHLVEPRTLPKLPNSENGLTAKIFRSGGKVEARLFDLESFPTPESEAIFAQSAIGDAVVCSLEIQEGATIALPSIKSTINHQNRLEQAKINVTINHQNTLEGDL